jgi:hypothetical protein
LVGATFAAAPKLIRADGGITIADCATGFPEENAALGTAVIAPLTRAFSY